MKYVFHAALLGVWGLIISQIQTTESTWDRWGYAGAALALVFVAIVVEAYFNERKENVKKIRSRKRVKKS